MKQFLVVGLFGVVTPLLLAPGCGSSGGARERYARGGDGGTTVAMGDAGATDRAGNTSATANGGTAGTATGEAGGSVGGSAGAAGIPEGEAGTDGTGTAGSTGSGGEAGENAASGGNAGASASGGEAGENAASGGSGTSGSAGAGGSGSGTVTTACAFPNGDGCDEFTGTPENAVDFESACAFAERIPLDACDTGYSGICTTIQGAATIRTFYYNLDATELAEAKARCAASPGTWSTP